MNKKLYDRKIAIINVGMTTEYGVPGPIFSDGTFKYLPIPEAYPSSRTPTYASLGLCEWVKEPNIYVHHDPEFKTMTYGDNIYKKNRKLNIRVANALKLRPNDFLFFFASLSNERDSGKRKTTGFFLIGFFEISQILPYEKARLSTLVKQNAHRLRKNDSGYSIWKGTRRSGLLNFAVPMSKRNVDRYLRTSSGNRLPWGSVDKNGKTRTELEVINSATRACRLIQPEFKEVFWKFIHEKNPELSVFDSD